MWPTIWLPALIPHLVDLGELSHIHHIIQSVNIWVIQIKAATWTHRCPASRVEMYYAMRNKSHNSSNKL